MIIIELKINNNIKYKEKKMRKSSKLVKSSLWILLSGILGGGHNGIRIS